jgi:ribokinase
MKILNFGSLNIDHVYAVDHFVRPGETLASAGYKVFMGGKGSNQSIALARAGAPVWHAGRIGPEGQWLRRRLEKAGVNVRFLADDTEAGGHAIIQVNREGENSIVLYGGANRRIGAGDARKVLRHFSKGDYLLLQNEISSVAEIMRLAAKRGMRIVLNPAPMNAAVRGYPLTLVDTFVVNEIEAGGLTGCRDPEAMLGAMAKRFPMARIVLTLGAAGVLYRHEGAVLRVPAVRVKAVDTTAAGDTFIGYFLAGLARGGDMGGILSTANAAAALCVMRPGAADSIPLRREVKAFMKRNRLLRG